MIWIFQSRGNKINRLHEKCLRIIYSDRESTFIELLEKDYSVLIHKEILRFLSIDMFKFKRGLAPALCKEMIPQNRPHRFESRNNPILLCRW